MRATVLCILAIAGATCALQLPSLPSPLSALNPGSSILDNIPGIKHGDDSSSSGSSSEEDQKASDIATELAERLVDDIVNAAGGIGSIALLPLNIGTSIFKSVTKEISNFLGNVLHPEDLNRVPELAVDLARIVIHDVTKLAGNVGSALLEPAKFKAQLVQTIAAGVDEFLKNVQNTISGDSSAQNRLRPNERRHERPQSSDPQHQPSSEQPGSTQSSLPPTSPASSTHPEGIKVRRDIGVYFSGSIGIDQVIRDSKVLNLGKALVTVDFSQIVKPIPKIPDLTPLNKLSPEVASITKRARNLVIHTIAAGASTIEEAIQIALTAAIRNVHPAEAVVNLVNIILQVYFFVAQSALAVPPAATALLKEAVVVGGSLVSSLLAAMSDQVADGVRALLN